MCSFNIVNAHAQMHKNLSDEYAKKLTCGSRMYKNIMKMVLTNEMFVPYKFLWLLKKQK